MMDDGEGEKRDYMRLKDLPSRALGEPLIPTIRRTACMIGSKTDKRYAELSVLGYPSPVAIPFDTVVSPP